MGLGEARGCARQQLEHDGSAAARSQREGPSGVRVAGNPAARLPLRYDTAAGKPRSAKRYCQAAQPDATSDA